MREARILVVDDHPVMREGLRSLLEQEVDLTLCGGVPDAVSAVTRLRETECDLVLVDISLDGSNGIDLIKQIKAAYPDQKVLVISMHDEAVYAERSLRAGALGFVNKESPAADIVDAVRSVLAGRVYLSRAASQNALRRIAAHGVPDTEPVDQLSDRELEIYEMIGRGRTTRGIAEALHLSVKTVETHRERIKTKLQLESGTQLVHRAIRWVVEQTAP